MTKRKPIIYIAGSCKSGITQDLKNKLKQIKPDLVKYIDPAKFEPDRDKYEEVSKVNDSAINLCDLMICVLMEQTAGASIELYINCQILNKPALIATNIPNYTLTPRIRSLCNEIHNIAQIRDRLIKWIEDWYDK